MRASLAFVILLLPSAMAQEVAADFSEGLNRLAALGLPEMKEAEWVKLPRNSGVMGYSAESYQLREIGVNLSGGAWRLKGEPARTLGFGEAKVTVAESSKGEDSAAEPEAKEKSPGLLGKMLRNYDAQKKPEEDAKEKPAPKEKPDLAEADAKLLVEALGKEKARKELAENMGYGRYDTPGQLLVFAAQLQAAGKTDAANRLAGALFSLAQDKTALVDAAVSKFASSEYETATAAFFSDYDWTKYHETLKGLLAKYPRGWDQAGAIAILMAPLEKRAKGEKPPTPSLPGIELKPEALALLDSLLERQANSGASDEALAKSHGIDLSEIPAQHRARYLQMLRQQGMGESGGGLWLLVNSGGDDAAGKLTAMGMDGLIALAAVVTDDTLLPLNLREGSSYFSYGSNRSAEEVAMETYRRMSRPTTRGELATMLLGQVIPGGENDLDEEDPESFQAAAVDFWKENRGKSSVELAALYVAGGDSSQRSSASQVLATMDDPQAHAAFEKAVLTSGEPTSFLTEVESYLETRKADGKAFLDRYGKLLRESVANKSEDDYDSGYYQLKESGGVEKYLKKLSRIVGGASLKEIVDEALKAEPEEGSEESPIVGLAETVGKAAVPEVLTVIGEAMPKAKPEQKMDLYALTLKAIYARGRSRASDEKEAISAPVTALWKPLLADTEAIPEEGGEAAAWAEGFGAKTVGDYAALVFEVAADPSSGYNYQIFGPVGSPADLMPFVRARVNARIEGKEPEPWPAAGNLPAARRTEIEAKLGSLPAKEVISYAKSLTTPERLAVLEIMGAYGEGTEAPANLLELRDTVSELRSYNPKLPHDTALLEKLGIAPGWRISPENVQKIAEGLAKDAKVNSATCLSIFPGPMQLGMVATAANQLKVNPNTRTFRWDTMVQWMESQGRPEALVMFCLGNSIDLWTVKDGKVARTESGTSTGSALEKLKEIQASKSATLPYLQIAVLASDDAKKFQEEEDEAEEE